MTIEIHQPELEALIQRRMATGHFQSVEDVLIAALKSSPDVGASSTLISTKKNLTQFLKESPLWGSGIELERNKDLPRPISL